MVPISSKQELLLSSDACVFRQQIATVLECMREELDDHRLAVNENTDELAASNDVLNELCRRMDKMSERLDELTLLVKGAPVQKTFEIRPLSAREKEVFQALYVLTESQPYASYDHLAKKTALSRACVIDNVASMVEKGVPLVKKVDGTTVFLKLDEEFRQIQAKKNVIGLNASLTAWIPRA